MLRHDGYVAAIRHKYDMIRYKFAHKKLTENASFV